MTAQTEPTPQTGVTSRELADQINALAVERSSLYRQATDGWTSEQRDRLKEIDATLATLWVERRRIRAGHDEDEDEAAVPVRRAA